MKITDIISGEKPSLSFEVFPPKSGANFETVEEAAPATPKIIRIPQTVKRI